MQVDSRPVSPFFFDLTDTERAEVLDAVSQVLASGQLILGPQTDGFEAEFASYIGVKHAVSVSTGTSALEIILRAKGVEGRKVAVPSNTNFATVAAIMHAGGHPIMLDMSPETFMPTLAMLEEAHAREHLAGAMWVHIGGLIAPDFERCVEFCHNNGMFMIEDAAHAHGSALASAKAGALADAGAFSFFPTKVMTTLEGGMITTDDDHIAEKARSLRNQGKGGAKFGNEHIDLGNSWRINEIGAAVGRVQLRKLDRMVETRQSGARAILPDLERLGLAWCAFDHMAQFSGYKLIVRVPESDDRPLGDIKAASKELGVILGGGVYEKPCHLQPVFAQLPQAPGGYPVSEALCPRHICPPITSGTGSEELARIRNALDALFA